MHGIILDLKPTLKVVKPVDDLPLPQKPLTEKPLPQLNTNKKIVSFKQMNETEKDDY